MFDYTDDCSSVVLVISHPAIFNEYYSIMLVFYILVHKLYSNCLFDYFSDNQLLLGSFILSIKETVFKILVDTSLLAIIIHVYY